MRNSGGYKAFISYSHTDQKCARWLHRALLSKGIRTVLRRGCDGRVSVSLVVTARHQYPAIDRTIETISELVNGGRYR